MRCLNQMSNLNRIFDCLSRRSGEVVFNLIDSNVASHMHLILGLNSAPVKFDVLTGP